MVGIADESKAPLCLGQNSAFGEETRNMTIVAVEPKTVKVVDCTDTINARLQEREEWHAEFNAGQSAFRSGEFPSEIGQRPSWPAGTLPGNWQTWPPLLPRPACKSAGRRRKNANISRSVMSRDTANR